MGRSCEVDKFASKGFNIAVCIQPASAPFPATNDRINDGNVDYGEDNERIQSYSFSNSTGYDGCSSCSKHSLEQKVSPVGISSSCIQYTDVGGAHGFDSKTCETKPCARNPGVSRIHQIKSQVHNKHQKGGNHHPDVVRSKVAVSIYGVSSNGAYGPIRCYFLRYSSIKGNGGQSNLLCDRSGHCGSIAFEIRSRFFFGFLDAVHCFGQRFFVVVQSNGHGRLCSCS